MFDEYVCGCIVSRFVGRVRICDGHRPERATGDGGMGTMHDCVVLRGVRRSYPAHGEMPDGWTGR